MGFGAAAASTPATAEEGLTNEAQLEYSVIEDAIRILLEDKALVEKIECNVRKMACRGMTKAILNSLCSNLPSKLVYFGWGDFFGHSVAVISVDPIPSDGRKIDLFDLNVSMDSSVKSKVYVLDGSFWQVDETKLYFFGTLLDYRAERRRSLGSKIKWLDKGDGLRKLEETLDIISHERYKNF